MQVRAQSSSAHTFHGSCVTRALGLMHFRVHISSSCKDTSHIGLVPTLLTRQCCPLGLRTRTPGSWEGGAAPRGPACWQSQITKEREGHLAGLVRRAPDS